MKRVILESPLAGNVEENLQYARECLHDSLVKDEAPIASHLLYPQCLDDSILKERTLGIEAGLSWYPVSDYSVVYVDKGISNGMKLGMERARKYQKPCKFRRLNPLPNPFYILISGKRCSGKDTFALQLQELLPSSTIFGLAHTLKYLYAQQTTPENVEGTYLRLVNDYAFKQQHRHQLIDLAKQMKKEHGDDIWVRRHQSHPKTQEGIVIIPDVRVHCEIKPFTRENSIKIRISTSDSVRKDRGWNYLPSIDDDILETDLDTSLHLFDRVIENNGTPDELKKHTQDVVTQYALIFK